MSLDFSMRTGVRPPVADTEGQPSRFALGPFVSLRDVAGALHRRWRFLAVMALVGLLVPFALSFVLPAQRSATVTLYLTHPSGDDPNLDMATDVALLQTGAVAQRAVDRYGLGLTPANLEKQYRGAANGVSILQITATGPSSAVAVQRANAVAHAFLGVRSALFESQNRADVAVLAGQVADLQNQVNRLSDTIGADQSSSSSSSTSSASAAVSQRGEDLTQIADIQQSIQTDTVSTRSVVDSSTVLVPATPVAVSHLKGPAIDAVAGMLAGVALAVGVVVAATITSDRIRRRRDFALALGVPVELSVGPIASPRLLPVPRLRRHLRRKPGRSLQLMVRYLRSCLVSDPGSRLVVVSIGSRAPSALAVVSLAHTLARDGLQVVIVDLSASSFLGRLLGVDQPGPEPSPVVALGGSVQLLVPTDDLVPALFNRSGDRPAVAGSGPGPGPVGDPVVLVLLSLDPGVAAARIRAWTGNAVAVVTAGGTNTVRTRADADVARSAGLILRSAILVGADHDDDTSGTLGRVEGAADGSDAPDAHGPVRLRGGVGP